MGTITQSLFLAIHELAHNLFFQGTQANRLFAMVANWPIGIAYCVPFRGYHLEHHKWQGVDGIDTDIPSRFEGKYVRGPVLKAIWCCCQILTYALGQCSSRRRTSPPTICTTGSHKSPSTSSSSTFGATSRLPTSCSASSWREGCTRVRGTSSPSTTSSRTSTPRRRPT